MPDGTPKKFPAIYRRVRENRDYFLQLMHFEEDERLDEVRFKLRLSKWCDYVSKTVAQSNRNGVTYEDSRKALEVILK